MGQITREDLEKLGVTKTKVTIGELLGIANKAASMDWSALADSFAQASNMQILKSSPSGALINTFKTVLNAFGIGVKAAQIVQKLRPIINLVVKIAGLWSNPALLKDIVAEAAASLKNLLLSLAITGVNYAKNLILAITIDLGFLFPEDIEKVTDDVNNSINEGYNILAETIENYVPDSSEPSIADFSGDISNAFSAMEDSIHEQVNNATTVSGTIAAVNAGLSAYTDSSVLVDRLIYGQDAIPNTGGNNNYYYGDYEDILSPTTINMDELQNGRPTSDGDTSYLNNIPENTPNTNLLLNEIEKNIQYNKNNLLDNIRTNLGKLDVDTTSMEANYPEEDALILRNFKDSLLSVTRDTIYNQAAIAFNSIFDFTEDQLKKLLALYAIELIRQLNFNMSQCLFYTNAYINGLNVNTGNSDPAYLAQLKTDILNYMTTVCQNKPDPAKVFQKVMFDYLWDIFQRSKVDNQTKSERLMTLAMNGFYYTKEDFLNSVKNKIRLIRIKNDVIDSTYYDYSYSDLYSLLNTNILAEITNSTATTVEELTQLIVDVNNAVFDTINDHNLSVVEHAHPDGESVGEKMKKMRTEVFYEMKDAIANENIPEIDYETLYVDLTIEEKKSVSEIIDLIYTDYKRKLISIASSIVIDLSNVSIQVPSDLNIDILMSDCITEQDSFIKQDIIKNVQYGLSLVSLAEYANPLTEAQITTIKTNIQTHTINMLNSTSLVLNFPERFSAILKEQEVKLILGVVDNLNI